MLVSSKDTNFEKISHLSKESEDCFQIFVAFSEYLNFD